MTSLAPKHTTAPSPFCIHELVEQQVVRSPQAIAVAFEGATLTYAQLNQRANQVAHYLNAQRVKRDECVGICMERSLEMVVAMLGVLKAGAAYLPLDPSYPAERLDYILRDAAPRIVLAQTRFSHLVGENRTPLFLDAQWHAIEGFAAHNIDSRDLQLESHHLAYVMYTSGSTGRPKGVMCHHRGAVNRLRWANCHYPLNADDRIVQKTPFNFDVSVWEFFWPLSAGARLVVAKPQGHQDANYLSELIEQQQITVAHFVPSMLRFFIEFRPTESCRSLRRVFCSGEELPAALQRQFMALLPRTSLHNLYGPTEASIEATYHDCVAGDDRDRVPIGQPIANVKIHILDEQLRPVENGAMGEIYIGGVAVARGYLNLPQLTAERFLRDPFSVDPHDRMYKTGDLGRWVCDGVEFLGRNDFQVKLRGLRIELGEIEAQMCRCPGVQSAVVVARTDAVGEMRLIGYFIQQPEEIVTAEQLRGHLQAVLAPYMVPSQLMVLDSLPLTPSGKLDRNALPAPPAPPLTHEPDAAPIGPRERLLAEVWSQVLGFPTQDRRAHFFDLGGHSLLAIRMISLLRHEHGMVLSLADVFAQPVLADLAQMLRAHAGAGGTPIPRIERKNALPIGLGQRGLWFVAQMQGGSEAYHVPLRLQLRGELDEGSLERALQRIVERHEVLRTRFIVEQGEPVQRIDAYGATDFKLRRIDLRMHEHAQEELERLVAREVMVPFDLKRGPLMRGLLVRSAGPEHTLLLTLHHIVSDGWSLEVLLKELGTLYAAYVRGESDPLPELPVQYVDYAAWHRGWIEGEMLRAQGDYWKARLGGAPALLELPTDRPRPSRQDYQGGFEEVVLDRELTAGLKALSQRHGTTLFMTLLAAWTVLLSRLSGQRDIVIGTPTANRTRPEAESLIGYFVNMLAVRIEASGSVATLLARTKEAALAAQEHQDIPFERVVELLQPERNLAYSPIFQATFAWENLPTQAPMAGLETRVCPDDGYRVAQFDVTLLLQEKQGRVCGRLAYATALFDAATISRYSAYFFDILTAMVADEAQEISYLPYAAEASRQPLLPRQTTAPAAQAAIGGAEPVPAQSEFEAPRGELEEMLAGLWSQLLGVELIGRHDNFFKLGGHSLLAVHLVMLLREQGLDCSAQEIWTNPTLADMASHLKAETAIEPIPKADRSAPCVLSFSQQRLWFLAQLDGGSEAYHVPLRLQLRGELDEGSLERALQRIVERHEVLRTRFIVEQGEPVQRIDAYGATDFKLRRIDLRMHEHAQEELERLVAREVMVPFDLKRGPLMRGLLVRSAGPEHTLLLTLHHIVSDGWSLEVLLKELGTLYAAYVRGESDPLPELPVQYVDYAAWHRGWIEGEMLRAQGDYWKARLGGAPALLELPTDRPRPSRQDYQGGFEEVVLDRELTAGLKALSQRHGTTLFMTLLAAWTVLLSRLSGQRDIVIGTPTANRTRPDTQGMVGCFVNALALRIEATGSMAELLARTKEVALSAQEHQDIPFERVVELVQPERSLAYSPIFQVVFNWQAAEDAPPALPGLNVDIQQVGAYQVAKVDQTLYLREQNGRIVGGTAYAASLFDGDTIQRYQGYLVEILRAVVADDGRAIQELPLLGAAERHQLLEANNATPAAFDNERLIHELFEAQAAATPHALAVVQGEQRLTYAELDARANVLAASLIELSVAADARVGVCLQRSPAMIIAILGVMKSGGAYVPLDPTYPEHRLVGMIEDSEPAAVIVDGATRAVVQELVGSVPLISIDSPQMSVGGAAAGTRRMPAWADARRHLAYIMYTSGSTGKPKGVMVEHRGFPNLVLWYVEQLQLKPSDCMLIATSLSFDLTQRNILGPLLVGARLCLAPQFFDPQSIVPLLGREQVSLMNVTPSMFRALLDAGLDEARTCLRQVVFGGETVRIADMLELKVPRPRFMNVYGPTEGTGVVAFHPLAVELERYQQRSVPLGHSLPNTRIYVLDSHRQPVPTGVAGEIFIGGIGVARGYRNRAELTAEKFLEDPFAVQPGARMYRTGDLGRWRADGNLEYLGRNDFQVKIRGFRIELGEIEAQLLQLAGVASAVVVARGEASDQRLIAYYSRGELARSVPPASAEELRMALRQSLPEYMVPAAYVELEALPLTPNGKVDRHALPAPGADAYGKRAFELPEDDIERLIAGTWERLLKAEQVGRHDNFFELGGHSLLAMQLVSQLQEKDLNLSAVDLWVHPTVAELAECVRARGQVPLGNSAICINRSNTRPPLFFAHDGLTQLLYVPVVTRALERDIPLYGLPAQPKEETRHQTLEQHAARMVRMIRQVQAVGPYHLAGYSFGGMLAYEIATQLTHAGQNVDFLCLLDTRRHIPGTSPFEHSMGDLTEDQQLLMFLRYEFFEYSDLTAVIDGIDSMDMPRYDFDSITRVLHQRSLIPKPYDRLTLPQLRHYLRCGLAFLNAKVRHSPKQLSIPVQVFASQDSLGVDPLLHWGGVIPNHLIHIAPVSGTHFSMMQDPNAQQLAEKFARSFVTATASAQAQRELNAERRGERARAVSRHSRRQPLTAMSGERS